MKTYQITIPDELAALVDRALAEKKWDTLDNLVADALGAELESEIDQDTASLRDAVRVGIEQVGSRRDHGRGDGSEAVARETRGRAEAAHMNSRTNRVRVGHERTSGPACGAWSCART